MDDKQTLIPPPAVQLLRSCSFPDGEPFGVRGPMWGYEFNAAEKWGQIPEAARKAGALGQHGGRDIKAPYGTYQVSPADGKVIAAWWQDPRDHKRGFGLYIMLDLGEYQIAAGKFARLWLTGAHLSEVWAKVGAQLSRGEAFGRSGRSGNVDGPHIHWQLEIAGPWPRTPLNFSWVNV